MHAREGMLISLSSLLILSIIRESPNPFGVWLPILIGFQFVSIQIQFEPDSNQIQDPINPNPIKIKIQVLLEL